MQMSHIQLGTNNRSARAVHTELFKKFQDVVELGLRASRHMGRDLRNVAVLLASPDIVQKCAEMSAAAQQARVTDSYVCMPHPLDGFNTFLRELYPGQVDDDAYALLGVQPGRDELWVVVATNLGFTTLSVKEPGPDERYKQLAQVEEQPRQLDSSLN